MVLNHYFIGSKILETVGEDTHPDIGEIVRFDEVHYRVQYVVREIPGCPPFSFSVYLVPADTFPDIDSGLVDLAFM